MGALKNWKILSNHAILHIYAPTTHQININQYKLFGVIVLLIFHLSCIIRGHMENVTLKAIKS